MVGTQQLRERLPFNPEVELLQFMPRFEHGIVPRYLFRVYSPHSAGTTTTSHAKPPAAVEGHRMPNRDIFSISPDAAGNILHSHLAWRCNISCNLISWTSSILFALQYGLYRHRGDEMWNMSSLSDIRIMIIDTRQFPEHTFIKDIEAIQAIYPNVDTWPSEKWVFNLRKNRAGFARDYYFGEYLSQGDLDLEGRCAQTTMDALIRLGLFDVHDDFRHEELWRHCANSILDARGPFRDPIPHELTKEIEIDRAFKVASGAFGEDWALAVALMLLALKPRSADDPVIISGITKLFTYERIRNSLGDARVDGHRLPEVKLYGCFVENVLQHVEVTESPREQNAAWARVFVSIRLLTEALKNSTSAIEADVERRMGGLSVS